MHWREQLSKVQKRKMHGFLKTYGQQIAESIGEVEVMKAKPSMSHQQTMLRRSINRQKADLNRVKAILKRLERFL